MKRFSNTVKTITKNEQIHKLACYSFSLLLNSTDLNELSDIFKQIVILLKTEFANKTCAKGLDYIHSRLRDRVILPKTQTQSTSTSAKFEEVTTSKKKSRATIKEKSKFTGHLQANEDSVAILKSKTIIRIRTIVPL